MLKVKGIDIFAINGISDIKLVFEPGINIICGRNGIGKTTILDCIHAGITNKKNKKIRSNVNIPQGYYFIYGFNDFDEFFVEKNISTKETNLWNNRKISDNILHFTIHRTQYNSSKMNSITKWFAEMFDKDNLSISEYDDLKLAIECFEKLDSNIKFSRVVNKQQCKTRTINKGYSPFPIDELVDNFEIIVSTNKGELPLTYLSAGYLSCLSIFLEIIKKAKTEAGYNKSIIDYDGLILIDEIDLHLHPEWQKKILEILKWMVPNAQIIATTHSPHIVQAAEANEVITIKSSSSLFLAERNYSNSEYGYQGWSIEEILEDVMGLKNTHSDLYNNSLHSIKESLKHFEINEARRELEDFKKLLHPNNPLGKILSIQIASTGNEL